MHRILLAGTLVLGSCARFTPNISQMTPDQILRRSTHIFIGVIEKHDIPNDFLFRVSGEGANDWRVQSRRVRIEIVVRGIESRPIIDIYEVVPAGGRTGHWNATQDRGRYLFPVRLENGHYRLARDHWLSIYSVSSGRHDRLPLDDSRSLWERLFLLQWWVKLDRGGSFGDDWPIDPAGEFFWWRRTKLLRGLLRHPEQNVRLVACEQLLHLSMAQDECWDSLDPKDRQSLNRFWNMIPPQQSWNDNRNFEKRAPQSWDRLTRDSQPSLEAINELRLFTTINNPTLRREFCVKFRQRFPQDNENGCPSDRPPPATIVTQDGDIPLVGEWPRL